MKRMFLIVATVLCFISAAFAEPWRVFDNAGLFSVDDIAAIEQEIFTFQRNTNFDFAVLTTDDYIGKENWAAVADSFYDSEDFGFGQQASGMLYYIDMHQRVPYISTAGNMITIFDNATVAEAHDSSHSFLAEGKYKEAVLRMIESATEAVQAYKKSTD